MNRTIRDVILIIVCASITACGSTGSPEPTISPVPTSTSTFIPTSTASVTPTITYTPTATPKPVLPVLLGTPMPMPVTSISLESGSQVLELARWGKGVLYDLLFSPDGKYLVVQTRAGYFIYNAGTFTQLRVLEGMGNGMAFSSDGKMLAYHSANSIHILDMDTMEEKCVLPNQHITDLTFSPDGKILAFRNLHLVGLLDASTCTVTGELKDPIASSRGGSRSIAFSPDGKLLATTNDYDFTTVLLFDPVSGKIVNSLHPETVDPDVDSVQWIMFSPDGKSIFIKFGYAMHVDSSNKKNWMVLDVASGKEVPSPKALMNGYILSISPDWSRVAWGFRSMDQIRIYDFTSENLISELKPEGPHNKLAVFTYDDQYLATGDQNGSILIWSTGTGKMAREIGGFFPSIEALSISPDGKTLASCMDGIGMVFWNISTGQQLSSIPDVDCWQKPAFSPDWKYLAADRESHIFGFVEYIDIRNLETGMVVKTIDNLSAWNWDYLTFSPDGKVLAQSARSTQTILWDTETWEVLKQFASNYAGPMEYPAGPVFSPDGRFLAGCAVNGTIEVRDVENGQRQLMIGRTGCSSLAYSPDGTILASGEGTEIRMWDSTTGQFIRSMEDLNIKNLLFSPDGQMLVSAGNHRITFWDTATGQEIFTSKEYYAPRILSLVAGPSWNFLVSGSQDGTIRFWGIEP